MTEDLETTLAILFRKTGSPATPDELVQTASLGLGWCKPSQAWNLVARGLDAGVLRRMADDRIAHATNPQEVTVPLGYAPPPELFEEAEGLAPSEATDPPEDPSDVFEAILDRLRSDGSSRQEAVATVNRVHSEMGGLVAVDVAGLVALRASGLEFEDLLGQVRDGLRVET